MKPVIEETKIDEADRILRDMHEGKIGTVAGLACMLLFAQAPQLPKTGLLGGSDILLFVEALAVVASAAGAWYFSGRWMRARREWAAHCARQGLAK